MRTRLGRGIYDANELAHILSIPIDSLSRWTTPTKTKPAIVSPSLDGAFSFHDLISLHVVKLLRRRGVELATIRVGAETLSAQLETDRPFAHRELATVGRAFFARVEPTADWLDAGRGGQSTLWTMVEPELQPIEYDADEMANRWRPHRSVVLDPLVQAGTPCIESTRIPTKLLAELVAGDDELEDLADDYDLTVEAVRDAVDYEQSLEGRRAA